MPGSSPGRGTLVNQDMRFSSRSITCPRCGLTSYHPHDVAQRYCPNCHWWTSVELLADAMVDGEHQRHCNRPQCVGCKVDTSFFLPT
jgi:ribosomal protein L37E